MATESLNNNFNNMSTKRVAGISAATTIGVLLLMKGARMVYNAMTTTKVVTDTVTHRETGTGPAAS